MKRTIIASAAFAGLLSTSLFAYGNMGHGSNMHQCQGKKMHGNAHQCMKKGVHKKGMYQGVERQFIKMLHQLNLTQEQYGKIKTIMHTPMKKEGAIFASFSKDSFDKEKYIQQMKQKRENMLKFKAEKIEKIYNVLTTKQKSQLRVLMDLHEGKGK